MKGTPYFVRAWIKDSCGTVSDSCKIISKRFLTFASDSPITAERAAAFMQGLSASWPASQAPHRSYRLSYNQHKDHGVIIYLSLRNTARSTKHLNLNITGGDGSHRQTMLCKYQQAQLVSAAYLSCKTASLEGAAETRTGTCHLHALPEKLLPAHHQHRQ